ncbi:DISARM system phospholipase D-like protein DrmC [bacterium]|nr:DISARM system phospholipase D-like protein DrmC [bacterium]
MSALETGVLPMKCSATAVRSVIGLRSSEGAREIVDALQKLVDMGLTGSAAAAWIRHLEKTALQAPRPDLVWSGPEVPGLHVRDTRQVYDELLSSATRSLWISTFVYYDGPRAFEVLARQMEAQPDLSVNILLNIQRKWNDGSLATEIVRRFAARFWDSDWPGSVRPAVYYDPRSLEPDRPAGVLHAKAVVVDSEMVFVTSANLTEAAFDRNIELGMVVRDRALAISLESHFRVLIERGILRLLPNLG